MAIALRTGRRVTVGALLALTVVTGLVDALSYLDLGRVFVANMTGNVVFLGFSVHPHTGLSAVTSLIAIGGFLGGAFGGGWLAARLDRRADLWLLIAFGAEALILAATAGLAGAEVLPLGVHHQYATVVVLAVALGLQNSTVRHVGAADLTTTVLTLTLTGIAADSGPAGGPGSKPHRRLGSVAAMLADAVAGALLLQVSSAAVIAVAAALVSGVAITLGMPGIQRPADRRGDRTVRMPAAPQDM